MFKGFPEIEVLESKVEASARTVPGWSPSSSRSSDWRRGGEGGGPRVPVSAEVTLRKGSTLSKKAL